MKLKNWQRGEGELTLFIIGIVIAAWLTHVVACIEQNRIGLLFAGTLLFPVSVIHGIGRWFGAF